MIPKRGMQYSRRDAVPKVEKDTISKEGCNTGGRCITPRGCNSVLRDILSGDITEKVREGMSF